MATALPQNFPEPTSIGEIEIKSYPRYRAVTVAKRKAPCF
jgi:hypothetical protein